MPVPLILVWGAKNRLQAVGCTARTCQRCRRVQPFECFDQLRSEHIYFIHGSEHSIGALLVCDFCETSIAVHAGSRELKDLRISHTWNRGEALQALVDETSPALGRVVEPKAPSNTELMALLQSANERSSAAHVDIQGGAVAGGILGALALAAVFGLLAAVGLRLVDAPLGAIVGLPAGAVVGGFITHRRRSREILLAVLISAIERNSLTVDALQLALARSPHRLGRVARGLELLRSISVTGGWR